MGNHLVLKHSVKGIRKITFFNFFFNFTIIVCLVAPTEIHKSI